MSGVPALGVVQARMGSTRLPGKSVAPIAGRPLVALVVERLRGARTLRDVVVATSTLLEDDPVAEAARTAGARVHRGSPEDVLGRLAGAADGHNGPVVRMTADCPFLDPGVVDACVDLLHDTEGCAYASNVEPRSYPDGLDVEAMAGWALREAAAEATDPADREHVTSFIRERPDRFPRAALEQPDAVLAELRWTVDYEEDLEFARAVADRLGDAVATAGTADVLAAVRREPSLRLMHDQRGPRG